MYGKGNTMTKLEEFQEKCKRDIIDISFNNNRWNKLCDTQKLLGVQYMPIRGVLARLCLKEPRCPSCNCLLSKEIISYDGAYEKSIVHCLCGYEYAEEWRT